MFFLVFLSFYILVPESLLHREPSEFVPQLVIEVQSTPVIIIIVIPVQGVAIRGVRHQQPL